MSNYVLERPREILAYLLIRYRDILMKFRLDNRDTFGRRRKVLS